MDFKLKGCVLIIGSLFWQDHRDRKGDNIRLDWRNKHLSMDHAIDVRLPICYGRFSSAKSYTMLFSKHLQDEKKLGVGKAVPFRKNPIENLDELWKEVEEMSYAEGKGKSFIKGIKNGNEAWCVCCILFNPHLESHIKESILEYWNNKFKSIPDDHNLIPKIFEEKQYYCITDQGELDIQWPETVDPQEQEKLDSINFLIATATKPKLREGISELTCKEIANHCSNRPYFTENIRYGIKTWQDEEIEKLIVNTAK